jgi:hypothetical protein
MWRNTFGGHVETLPNFGESHRGLQIPWQRGAISKIIKIKIESYENISDTSNCIS